MIDSKLIIAATQISEDEPCLGLSEMNLQPPSSKGWRRYQIAYIMRSDKPVVRYVDLGPARKFKAPQFRIPGGVKDDVTGRFKILHTVGQLRDIADQLRLKDAAQMIGDPFATQRRV
jgi:hypothetical protein